LILLLLLPVSVMHQTVYVELVLQVMGVTLSLELEPSERQDSRAEGRYRLVT
jgi:hypothetical protein